jgi:hypothetical protein
LRIFECWRRGFTICLLTHATQFIERYPLRVEDRRLLHGGIILRKCAGGWCADEADEAMTACGSVTAGLSAIPASWSQAVAKILVKGCATAVD